MIAPVKGTTTTLRRARSWRAAFRHSPGEADPCPRNAKNRQTSRSRRLLGFFLGTRERSERAYKRQTQRRCLQNKAHIRTEVVNHLPCAGRQAPSAWTRPAFPSLTEGVGMERIGPLIDLVVLELGREALLRTWVRVLRELTDDPNPGSSEVVQDGCPSS